MTTAFKQEPLCSLFSSQVLGVLLMHSYKAISRSSRCSSLRSVFAVKSIKQEKKLDVTRPTSVLVFKSILEMVT